MGLAALLSSHAGAEWTLMSAAPGVLDRHQREQRRENGKDYQDWPESLHHP
jgi:hypothetical protein